MPHETWVDIGVGALVGTLWRIDIEKANLCGHFCERFRVDSYSH